MSRTATAAIGPDPARGDQEAPSPNGSAARRPLRVAMVHYSEFDLDSRVQRQVEALLQRGAEVDVICLGTAGPRPLGGGTVRVHGLEQSKGRGGASRYIRGYVRFLAGAARRLTALER